MVLHDRTLEETLPLLDKRYNSVSKSQEHLEAWMKWRTEQKAQAEKEPKETTKLIASFRRCAW